MKNRKKLGRINLRNAKIFKFRIRRQKHRVSDSRSIDFNRKKVSVGPSFGRRNNIFALSGADFHDKRIVAAPYFAHIFAIKPEGRINPQSVPAVRQIKQISAPVRIPCLLKPGIKPA